MLGGKRNDQITTKHRQSGRWHDQTAIAGAREGGDRVLEFTGIVDADRAHVDADDGARTSMTAS